MSRSDRLTEKHGHNDWLAVDNDNEESAARTRPYSLEDIMLRRRKKELLENVKDTAKETLNKSPRGSLEKVADHFESVSIYKHDKSSSSGIEKQDLEQLVKVSSGKKVESTCIKEDNLTEGKDRANCNLETKSSAVLNNIGRINKESKTGKDMHGWGKNERIGDNSEYEAENKHLRDSVNKDRYAETKRSKSENKIRKKYQIEDDENPNDYYHTERKHDKDRRDRGKRKKWLSNDAEVAEKKNHIDSADNDRHADGRRKYEREVKRTYRNRDDKSQGKNVARKIDIVNHNQGNYERKERQEKVRSHHEEPPKKRRRSRSREREDRRSQSLSPRARKHSFHNGEREEFSMLSQKDSSRKKHPDIDRSRVSINGSSGHHHRHGGSPSGLGGYSPRKRKSEAAVKTPSPSKYSVDKKRVGWDLPPVGTENPASALVSSSFQLSSHIVLSNMHDVSAATSVDPAIVKPLPLSFLNNLSTGKNANIDSVQLTQATRPMRRLYLENLPYSASEKAVIDCFNNLLLSAGVNYIQQAEPCISCILHKDRGQALVEFITAEDASAALSFDGSTLFGSIVKIRRPKDYVEVADLAGKCFRVIVLGSSDNAIYDLMLCLLYRVQHTGEPKRLVDTSVTISDVVVDSPNKVAPLLSDRMLLSRVFETVEVCAYTVSVVEGVDLQQHQCYLLQPVHDLWLEHSNKSDLSYFLLQHSLCNIEVIFIGGISNHLSSEMLLEIAGAFGSLKAYHFETEDPNGSCAFLEYVDHSVTIKACAGLNGMKLAGEVLTVVQAMPDASPLENGGKSPSYGIPEHAKPLLRNRTQVLKIKDVFTVDSLSSLSDMAIQDILEDVRSECARFGAIKSLNVVKHSSDQNLATKVEECDVVKNVDSKEASQDTLCVINNAKCSFSEKPTDPKSKGTRRAEFHYGKEMEEDNVDDGVIVDKHAGGGFDNKSCQGEQLVSDATVEDTGNKSIPSSIIQECPDHQDIPKVVPAFLDNMVANDIGVDIENRMVVGYMDSNSTVGTFQEGCSERDATSGIELVGPNKGINEEDDIYDRIFEQGSVLVEYGRTEACCLAAHCLHGRFFDGIKVTVEYVPLGLYKDRFSK